MPVDIDALAGAATMAAFGEPVVYVPKSGQAEVPGARGIFDRSRVFVTDPNTGAAVATMKTMLGVLVSDFPAGFVHAQGDRISRRGVTYDVKSAEPDGQGWVYLQLGLVGGVEA